MAEKKFDMGPVARPLETNAQADKAVADIQKFLRDFGPFLQRVRDDAWAWTNSPMSDAPVWDKALVYLVMDVQARLKRLEDMLEIQPENER